MSTISPEILYNPAVKVFTANTSLNWGYCGVFNDASQTYYISPYINPGVSSNTNLAVGYVNITNNTSGYLSISSFRTNDARYILNIASYSNYVFFVLNFNNELAVFNTNNNTLRCYFKIPSFVNNYPSGSTTYSATSVSFNQNNNLIYIFYANSYGLTSLNLCYITIQLSVFLSAINATVNGEVGTFPTIYKNSTLTTSTTSGISPSTTFYYSNNWIAFDNLNNAYLVSNANNIYKYTIDASGFFTNQTLLTLGNSRKYNSIIVNPRYNYLYCTTATTADGGVVNSIDVYTTSGTLLKRSYIPSTQCRGTMDQYGNYYGFDFSNNITSSYPVWAYLLIICFKEDTKILTINGYKSIQDLKKGDLIKTSQSGYKPIYKIGYSKMEHLCNKERIKDQLYKCSNENFPEVFEDLVITGSHSILVDEFKNEEERTKANEVNGGEGDRITENKYRLPACVDERTTVYEVAGQHTIYHFALENDDNYMNYGVYANGLLVETTSKRFMNELPLVEI